MAGRIRSEDIQSVRDRARIEEIVGEHLSLKTAGMDSLKGLCPFHDEKTPSFNVRPSMGLWHCFGCGEGGDAIAFVQRIHHLDFVEAIEFLAAKTGVQLRYEESAGTGASARRDRSLRQRIIEANRHAAAFYQAQLRQPAAGQARKFLGEKGFGPGAAQQFGVGYAPDEWNELARHLRSLGFTEAELVASGLCTQARSGLIDRFRNRVIWPINDITGDPVGFGARRLGEDGPKYLNTPETEVYKKARVLYGLDLAKKQIAASRQVVIVEGYTDVMAAHLAGVGTAVATCGTAFGAEHARLLRRILGDSADPAAGVLLSSGRARGGEVIFTFDGDEAGQKAALRAFAEDQAFATQTFVAVARDGLDPCDLRIAEGDQAVRDLVAGRVPLFEFVLRSILAGQDLGFVQGRVNALHAAAPVVASIRDRALRVEYARQLAGWLAMPENDVLREVSQAGRRRQPVPAPIPEGLEPGGGVQLPGPGDPVAQAEQFALAGVLQFPWLAATGAVNVLDESAFSVPLYCTVWEAIGAAGGLDEFTDASAQAPQNAAGPWLERVRTCAGPELAPVLNALLVLPLPVNLRGEGGSLDAKSAQALASFVRGSIAVLARRGINRRATQARAQISRVQTGTPEYQQLLLQLQECDQLRRQINESQY